MKDVFALKEELTIIRDRVRKISEDASWMKTPVALHTFAECLEIHNEINRILNRTISRARIQNTTRIGGRF